MYCVCGWGQTQASGVNNFLACTFFLRICFFSSSVFVCVSTYLYLFVFPSVFVFAIAIVNSWGQAHASGTIQLVRLCLHQYLLVNFAHSQNILKKIFPEYCQKILFPRFYSIYSDEAKQSAVKNTTGTLELLFFVN